MDSNSVLSRYTNAPSYSQVLSSLKPKVKRWALTHQAQVNEDNAKLIETFFRKVGYSDDGPICHIIVFRLPYYRRPSSTLCLPIDHRLVRDTDQEKILEDVDLVEESSFATLAFLLIEMVAIVVLLVLHCRRERARLLDDRETRSDPRRRTIYDATFDPIRI